MTLEGFEDVLDIAVPTLLFATGDWERVTVYRSPVVRDTDPMFSPIVDWIDEHEMTLDEYVVEDDREMMFGEGIAESWSRRPGRVV